MQYPGCGQNILFITTNISLLVKMFIISSPTITGVYNNTPELFSFCQFYFDNPVPGLLSSSLISHSTHNCDRLVPACVCPGPDCTLLNLAPGACSDPCHSEQPTPDSSTPSLIWTERSWSPTLGVKIGITCTQQSVAGHPIEAAPTESSVILKLCWTCSELK